MRVLLLVYDNESHIHVFPQGTAYIAAALRKAGHEVEIWSQDIHHYPESHLTELLDREHFDVVGLGFIAGYWQYQKVKKIAAAVNASKNRKYFSFILGGHGPSACPEFFLKKLGADIVVRGEGEATTLDLVKGLETPHRVFLPPPINGISFFPEIGKQENLVTAPNRKPVEYIDSIPWPAWDLFPIEVYRLRRMPHASKTDFVMPVLTARGCPYACNFCYRMEKGYRMRDPENVMDEVSFLHKHYGINYVYFSDELLMCNEERVMDFCLQIRTLPFKFKWFCSGRLNFAKPEILAEMKATGCVFINYGIESFDDEALERMGKHLTCQQIEDGIKATLAEGISPGFNIIWGNLGETKETLRKGVEFLLKYDDHSELRTIRPVTPYPGSKLYDLAIEMGKLEGPEDFYERKHVNSDLLSVNFTDLSDVEFHNALREVNEFLIMNYFNERRRQAQQQARRLYWDRNTNFRGFRQT
jgi:radical SAM superfamily enzyme YgiQ (UPF0313 family)